MQQYSTQVRFLSETKEQAHHHYIMTLLRMDEVHNQVHQEKTCPNNKIWAKEVRKRAHKMTNIKYNHNQAPAMVVPTKPPYFLPGTPVQVGHTFNAQLVVEIIITERIVNRTTSVTDVGQGHMLHTCAEHLPTQVRAIIFVCTVVAKITPQVTTPVSPMTTVKSPGQHQGTSTVLDHILEQIPKIWEFHKETHGTLQT